MAEYKDIKITPEVFERLKRRKDDGQSWSHFLRELDEKAYAWEERGSDVL